VRTGCPLPVRRALPLTCAASAAAQYKPRRGDALLFYSLHHNGSVDARALHGGCPVIKGEKWVATKWIRDKCFMC
jgi:hypothetical protein